MRTLCILTTLLAATSSCDCIATAAADDGFKGLLGKAILQNVPAQLNITPLRTPEGFAYRCEIKPPKSALRASILWKIQHSAGQLEETVNSALLPASALDAGRKAICQALIDDGVFFKLIEKALPGRNLETKVGIHTKKAYPPKTFPFLTEQSTITIEERNGQKYARCSTGRRVILAGNVQWKFDNSEVITTEKNTLVLSGRPSAKISCKYSALLWSENKQWDFNYFSNIPSIIGVADQEELGFVDVQFPSREALGHKATANPDKVAFTLKCQTSSNDWGCHVMALSNPRHQLVSYFKRVQKPSQSELTLELIAGKERVSRRVTLRTLNSGDRQFKSEELQLERDKEYDERLRCNRVTGVKLSFDGAEEQNLTFIWISERNKIISFGKKPYLDLLNLSQTVKRIRCGLINSDKDVISFGISNELSLMQGFVQVAKNNWIITKKENNFVKLRFELVNPGFHRGPISSQAGLIDSKSLVCYFKSSLSSVFPKNLCQAPARLISRGENPTYEVELNFSQADTMAAGSSSTLNTKDRMAPRETEIVIAEPKDQPMFGIFKLQLLRMNHAPEIIRHVFTAGNENSTAGRVNAASDREMVTQPAQNICEVTYFDADNDHLVGSISFLKENIFQNLFSTFSSGSPQLIKSHGKDEFRVTTPENLGVVSQDCFVTLSDGVLISKSRASLWKDGVQNHSRTLIENEGSETEVFSKPTSKAPNLNVAQTFDWLGNSQELNVHFYPLNIKNFGTESFELNSAEQTPVVDFCLAEKSSCPEHTVSKGRIVITKTSSLDSGVYIFGTSRGQTAREFFVFDVFNDGYSSESSSPLKSSRTACNVQENHKASRGEFCLGDTAEKKKTRSAAGTREYRFPKYEAILPSSDHLSTAAHLATSTTLEKIVWEALLAEKMDSLERVFWKKPAVCNSQRCLRTSEAKIERTAAFDFRIEGNDSSGQKYLLTIPIQLIQEDSGKKQYLSQMYHEGGESHTPGQYVCEVSRFEESPNEKPFKVLLLSLGKVIRSYESFDNKVIFPEEPEKELIADSCEFYLGGNLIAQTVIKPSSRSRLICAVTTRDGWTSSVPCNFTGKDSARALSLSQVNLYLGNLLAQPELVMAAWISSSDQVEKGFVHRFALLSTSTPDTQPQIDLAQKNRNLQGTFEGEHGFIQKPDSENFDRFQLEYFDSDYALSKASLRLVTSLLENQSRNHLTIYCRFPRTKAEMCEVLSAMLKSKLTKSLTAKGSTLEMKQESIDGPFGVLEASLESRATLNSTKNSMSGTAVQIFLTEKPFDNGDEQNVPNPSLYTPEKSVQKQGREIKPQ